MAGPLQREEENGRAPQLARPSLGTRIGTSLRQAAPVAGQIARDVVNTPVRNLETAANVTTAVPRAVGGIVRDAAAAVRGETSPQQGQPLGPVSLPRLTRSFPGARASNDTPARAPASPVAALAPRPAAAAPPARPTQPAAPAPATPPAPQATLTRASQEFAFQPGDVNTFTGANGATRPVPGLVNAPQQPAEAGPPQVATLRGPSYQPRGRQGAVIENPGDSVVDRLTRALGSYTLKGSPSARSAVAQAILGEEAAARDERASALRTGDEADLAAIDNQARAEQSFLQRRLDADRFNVQTSELRADRAAEREQRALDRQPTTVTGADGSVNVVRGDGTFSPVTNAQGATLRAPMAPRQTGELTDDARLKSYTDRYTDRYNAIMGDVQSTPESKRQSLAELDADPLYAGLRPQALPNLQQFVQAARAAGSRMTDEQLTAAFQERYGN